MLFHFVANSRTRKKIADNHCKELAKVMDEGSGCIGFLIELGKTYGKSRGLVASFVQFARDKLGSYRTIESYGDRLFFCLERKHGSYF